MRAKTPTKNFIVKFLSQKPHKSRDSRMLFSDILENKILNIHPNCWRLDIAFQHQIVFLLLHQVTNVIDMGFVEGCMYIAYIFRFQSFTSV